MSFSKKFLSETVIALSRPLALRACVLSFLFLVITGPFGTFGNMTFAERLFYWTPAFVFSILLATVICVGTRLYLKNWHNLRRRLLSMVLFIIAFSPVLYVYNLGFISPYAKIPMSMMNVFIMVSAISFAMVAGVTLLEDSKLIHMPEVKGPRLLKRLPVDVHADVARLSVDDHYVKVFFADGREEKLLMRLSDAIGEMDETRGFVTHRSHWVSEGCVAGLIKIDGREFVQMECGSRVPVSRRYRPQVIASGIKLLEPELLSGR